MDVGARAVALYGRFSAGARDRLQREITERGGSVARDLTRRSDILAVGAQAQALIDSGALTTRLASARARGVPVLGEKALAAALKGDPPTPATLPLSAAVGSSGFALADVELLAAFDLVALENDRCAFADAGVIRTAAELLAKGRSRGDVVRILSRARDVAPLGLHRIVLTPAGEAALQWDEGLTTLEGQAFLPFDEEQANLEDLFEAAALAEARDEPDEAARLYDLCARADRSDPIAPYNLGNIRLADGAFEAAALAYQQALARDPGFPEARYNLAQALEAVGKTAEAEAELRRVLATDPAHADALFNLAQIRLGGGALAEARDLFERYLSLGPPEDFARTARKAILYCAAKAAVR